MRRWEIALACLGAALALVGIGVAAAVAMPPSLANLASEVSDGRTPTTLGEASVIVPADWIVRRESEDAVEVRTPDGALRARLDLVPATPAGVLAEADLSERARTELLASGLTAVHADEVAVGGERGGDDRGADERGDDERGDDGRGASERGAEEHGIVAGVGEPDAEPSVRVVVTVRAPDDAAATGYRAAIGELMEGIRR